MLKELFLAIILGALLGFGLTGGYFTLKKNPTQNTGKINSLPSATPTADPLSKAKPTINLSPTSTTSSEIKDTTQILVVDSPENETIFSNSKITVKGSASPQSLIVIITPIDTYTTKADNAGSFTQDVEIESGANIINVTSIDENDEQSSVELLVTYSTAKI